MHHWYRSEEAKKDKEEEKKKGGILPLGTGARTGSVIRWGPQEVLRGPGPGSRLSRLFGGRGLGGLPWLPELLPGQGFFGLTLSGLLASKAGFFAVVAALLAGSAALGTYLKEHLSKPGSSASAFSFGGGSFRGHAGLPSDLPTDRKGYDNSMLLFNDANKGGLQGVGKEGDGSGSGEEEADDKVTVSGPPSDSDKDSGKNSKDPSELAKKLAQMQGVDKDPNSRRNQYGSALGPLGSGGSYFGGGPFGAPGGLRDALSQGGGTSGRFDPLSSSKKGKATSLGRSARPAFGARGGRGPEGRNPRTVMQQLRRAAGLSNRGARTPGEAGNVLASRPFDASNPGGGNLIGGPGSPIGGTGLSPGTGGPTGGVTPDTTSGTGGPGNPNNTGGGGTTDPPYQGGPYAPEPRVPRVPGYKDVTPWGPQAQLAQTLITIASGLLLVAYIVSKIKPWGYAVAKWIAIVAMALAAIVTVMGVMMMAQYGQMLQGGIFTISGAVLTYLAAKAAEGYDKAAQARQEINRGIAENRARIAEHLKTDPKNITYKNGQYFNNGDQILPSVRDAALNPAAPAGTTPPAASTQAPTQPLAETPTQAPTQPPADSANNFRFQLNPVSPTNPPVNPPSFGSQPVPVHNGFVTVGQWQPQYNFMSNSWGWKYVPAVFGPP